MYCRDGSMHFSAVKEIDKSAAHFAWAVQHGKFDTRGMRIGRVWHALTLQEIEPYVFDGDRRGAKWAEFVKERSLQSVDLVDDYYQRDNVSDVLTPPEWDVVRWMRDRTMADHHARELLARCTNRETSHEWVYKGHPWRGKIDAHGDGAILELKSTKCAAKWAYLRDAGRMHYDAQLVSYDIALGAVLCGLDTEWQEHDQIAVENSAPFAVQVYQTANVRKDQALERLDRWMMVFDACHRAGDFGGYYQQGITEWDADIITHDEEEDEE